MDGDRVGGPALPMDSAATAALLLETLPPLVRTVRHALAAKGEPLTLTQARILARLESGPRQVGELAAAMEVRAPTASVAVNSLVQRGLVSRVVDEADRRVVPVVLTPQGRQIVRAARERQMRAVTRLLDRLDPAELRALDVGLRGVARVQADDCRDGTGGGAGHGDASRGGDRGDHPRQVGQSVGKVR